MNLQDCYIEEDLFPKIFTDYEEREYGILFFNTDNKDSYDSNHAVIYKNKIHDLQHVLSDITEFYKDKGSRPIIYQSMLDDNWFDEIQEELSAAGFKSWIEDQEYMLQADENRIIPNPDLKVRKVSEWSNRISPSGRRLRRHEGIHLGSAETGVMHSQRLSDMAAAFSGLDS